MFKGIKRHFQDLLNDEPGERFQEQFRRRHTHREHPFRDKLLFTAGGIIVVAVGILGLPLPGPGTLIIIIGLGLLAQESLRLSEFLDWLEVEIRQIMSRSKRWWKGASIVVKAAAVIFILIIFALAGWGFYWIATNMLGY